MQILSIRNHVQRNRNKFRSVMYPECWHRPRCALVCQLSESSKFSSSGRYNSIRKTCTVQSFLTCLKSEHIRPSTRTRRVFRLPSHGKQFTLRLV
eukprot:12887_5